MTPLVFSFPEVVQLVVFAFGLGGLYMHVRTLSKQQDRDRKELTELFTKLHDDSNKQMADIRSEFTKQVDDLTERQTRTEDRFINVAEQLKTSITNLTLELRTAFASLRANPKLLNPEG